MSPALQFTLGLVVLGGGAVAFALGLFRLTGVKLVAAVALSTAPVLAVSVAAVTFREFRNVPITLALGSNVALVGLVLGGAALARPLTARKAFFSNGVPILIAATLLLMFLARDDHLGRGDAVVLLVALAVAVRMLAPHAKGELAPTSLKWGGVLTVAGLGLLAAGSLLIVPALPEVIRALRWHTIPFGLTLLAGCVMVPALAGAVRAVRRGDADLVMGGVVAAGVANALVVFGVTALVSPLPFTERVTFDALPAALVFACLLLPVLAIGSKVPRWEGAILLAAYVAFVVWQVRIPAK